MTPAKKSTNRKRGGRMQRLREIRKKKREEAREQKTKEQAAILLKTWSRLGIVPGPAEPQ